MSDVLRIEFADGSMLNVQGKDEFINWLKKKKHVSISALNKLGYDGVEPLVREFAKSKSADMEEN